MKLAKKHAGLLATTVVAATTLFSQAQAQTAPYANSQSAGAPYARQGDCAGPAYDSSRQLRCTFSNANARRTETMPAPDGDEIDVWARYGTPLPQAVSYSGSEPRGTILIDHKNHHLYFIEGQGRATEYVIAVGGAGYEITGNRYTVTRKARNPDWRPTASMLRENPDWKPFYAGAPNMPLGSMALYLGNTLYRIHGTNDPEMIGHDVSDGCIRMQNADAIDLYNKVSVGAVVKINFDGVTYKNQFSALSQAQNNAASAPALR